MLQPRNIMNWKGKWRRFTETQKGKGTESWRLVVNDGWKKLNYGVQGSLSSPKVFKILHTNSTIHRFRGTVASRVIAKELGSRAFCAPRSEYSTQCVSQLFPLSVVFSAVSPSALRSFLPMCFRVGSVLRLLLSVSRSLVWAAYAGLLPSFKRLLRNSGFAWSSSSEWRRSRSISSSIK
jgi:hypothetical protein